MRSASIKCPLVSGGDASFKFDFSLADSKITSRNRQEFIFRQPFESPRPRFPHRHIQRVALMCHPDSVERTAAPAEPIRFFVCGQFAFGVFPPLLSVVPDDRSGTRLQ
jgi:hypothetical protein